MAGAKATTARAERQPSARVPGGNNAPPRTPAGKGPASRAAARSIDLGLLPGLLGYRLRLVQRAVFADFAASIGGDDVSPGLFGILVIVEANPGLKQSELAAAAHLDRSSIVPVVDKLEGRGFVTRRSSAADRRVNGVFLTAAGQTLLRRLKRRVLAHEQRISAALPPAERQKLFELLERLLPRSD